MICDEKADLEIPKEHLRLHYLRSIDSDYWNWGLYLWGPGYNAKRVKWGEPLSIAGIDSYGAYWDIAYCKGETFKFVIHNDYYRISDISGEYIKENGTEEIWVISGNSTVYFSLEEALENSNLELIPPIPTNYVRLNYYRPDSKYKGLQLKYWREGREDERTKEEGRMIPMGESIGGVYWDIPCRPCDDELKFSIYNEESKEVEGEHKYCNPNRNQEIWMMAGDSTEYYSGLEVLEQGRNEIKEAIIIDQNKIEVSFKHPVEEAIIIKDNLETVPLAKLDDSKNRTYQLITQQNLEYDKSYIVKCGRLEAETILSPEIIEDNLTYNGELGVFYNSETTEFKLWAPSASKVDLELFTDSFANTPIEVIPLVRQDNGVWKTTVEEDLLGKFYNYKVSNGTQTKRILDPYAKSMAGFDINKDSIGKGAVVDLEQTNPQEWENDDYIELDQPQDAVVYEMSVRDFTVASNSGVEEEKRGTYLGFIDKIPHLKELGITHVQLMPILNFYYGNEYKKEYEDVGDDIDGSYNYNWGYDPHNYFTPEGWYSLDPDRPQQRIQEVKELIQALHEAGIGVILDVVYNHTAEANIFEDIVPYYYYRYHEDGNLTNGSGCGNDTASERDMMRKLIIDSTTYWTDEYHVDGFRFDLMGLHDEKTVNKMTEAVKEINPSAIIYGEGWNLGTLPTARKYVKADGEKRSLLEIESAPGFFNDTIRDAIKHSHFGARLEDGGFIQQTVDAQELIRAGVIAGMVDYETDVPINEEPYHRFADDPGEVVSYVTCHDGHTLWDKIVGSTPEASLEERKKMHKLATAIILTAQGVAFLHGGSEILRSKPNPELEVKVDHNSYNSSDYTNQIDWSRKEEHKDIFSYYQGLIELRNNHQAFRLPTMKQIQESLSFIPTETDYLIGFRLEFAADEWEDIVVIYNANRKEKNIRVEGVNSSWQVVADDQQAGVAELTDTKVEIKEKQVKVPALSAVVLHN